MSNQPFLFLFFWVCTSFDGYVFLRQANVRQRLNKVSGSMRMSTADYNALLEVREPVNA
jgi:hypothetical protein